MSPWAMRTEMKNIYQVMQQKQEEIDRLKQEIDALNQVLPMLDDKEAVKFVSMRRQL